MHGMISLLAGTDCDEEFCVSWRKNSQKIFSPVWILRPNLFSDDLDLQVDLRVARLFQISLPTRLIFSSTARASVVPKPSVGKARQAFLGPRAYDVHTNNYSLYCFTDRLR
jgi:hypothetical protein